jgi:hypothetical protein
MGFLFGICSDCCQDEEEPCSPGTDDAFSQICSTECDAPAFPDGGDLYRNVPKGCLPAFAEPAGYVTLEITACYGSGAAATVAAPEAYGVCDYEGASGPIASVTVTNGGSGYAVLGRVAPTLTASIAGGSGATVTPTLAQNHDDDCGRPLWAVESLSASGGSGYADNADVTFSVAAGDTEVAAAEGKAFVGSTTPNPSGITTDGVGTGASLTLTFTQLASGDWVSRGYSGCPAPNDVPKRKTYALTGATISNGGSGYAQYDRLYLSFASAANGFEVLGQHAFLDVDSVDGSGAITGLYLDPLDQGKYAGALTDAIEKAIVLECSNKAGSYYRGDASEPALVATVTLTLSQENPSDGAGADLVAVVDDDPASATFGQITAITVDDGGSGYLQPPAGCEPPGENIYVTFGDHTGTLSLACGAAANDGEIIRTGQHCTYFRALVEGCACDGHVYITVFHFHVNCDPAANCDEGEEFDCGGLYSVVPDPYGVERYSYRLESDEDGCLTGEITLVNQNTKHFANPDGVGGVVTTTQTPPLPSQGPPSLSFMPP